MSKKEATVLFSGGSDSTLAAALLLQEGGFDKIHLLTFHHSAMKYMEKSTVNVERLEKKFGRERIEYKLFDVENIMQKLYYGNYLRDLRRYGVYMAAATCNVCQLAMHTRTAIYNIRRQIPHAYDGYKTEKEHVYVIMSKEGRKLLTSFYGNYGISYGNPVLDVLRTDWELFELGVTARKNVKFPYEHLDYEAQHSCYQGLLTNLYILGYNFNLFQRARAHWLEYLKEKLTVAKDYIDKTTAPIKTVK